MLALIGFRAEFSSKGATRSSRQPAGLALQNNFTGTEIWINGVARRLYLIVIAAVISNGGANWLATASPLPFQHRHGRVEGRSCFRHLPSSLSTCELTARRVTVERGLHFFPIEAAACCRPHLQERVSTGLS